MGALGMLSPIPFDTWENSNQSKPSSECPKLPVAVFVGGSEPEVNGFCEALSNFTVEDSMVFVE